MKGKTTREMLSYLEVVQVELIDEMRQALTEEEFAEAKKAAVSFYRYLNNVKQRLTA